MITFRIRPLARAATVAFVASLMALPASNSPALAAGPDDVKELYTQSLPADALDLNEAISAAKVGTSITLRGYLPSTPNAIAADGMSFTLAQTSSDKAGSEKFATVRLVDVSGKPLVAAVNGKYGLKPGAEVFVVGQVEQVSGTNQLTVVAKSVHIPRSPVPEAVFTTVVPQNVRDVSEVRKASPAPKVGEEITLRGRIGGSKEPFVPGRATITLVGRGIKACSENPDDACKFPWDYCCETKADITANSATIQLVDAKGQVLRTDLKGRRGIKELSSLVITGKVAVSDSKALVINATSIVVEP